MVLIAFEISIDASRALGPPFSELSESLSYELYSSSSLATSSAEWLPCRLI